MSLASLLDQRRVGVCGEQSRTDLILSETKHYNTVNDAEYIRGLTYKSL